MAKQLKFTLDNGWVVEKTPNGGILHVTPLTNSIFRVNLDIELPYNVLKDIENGELEIKELFRKHKLHNLIIQWGKTKTIEPKKNTSTKFYGRGFIATLEEGKYYFMYQLARQGGGSRKFEITKTIYDDIRLNDYGTSDLFKKYNLYHLDVPENDVKD